MGDIFDLSQELAVDKEKKKGSTIKVTSPQLQTGGATLFFTSGECRDSVLEAYRFEGLEELNASRVHRSAIKNSNWVTLLSLRWLAPLT